MSDNKDDIKKDEKRQGFVLGGLVDYMQLPVKNSSSNNATIDDKVIQQGGYHWKQLKFNNLSNALNKLKNHVKSSV